MSSEGTSHTVAGTELAPRSSLFDVDGHRLAVSDWGPVEAQDSVLFLHGAEFHSGMNIAEIAALLAAHGVRTVALDAPGYGSSPASVPDVLRPPAHLAGLAAEVARRTQLGTPLLAGHSWGSHVACWASITPGTNWRGLLLLDGGFFDFADLFARLLPGGSTDAVLDALHARLSALSFGSWPDYFDHIESTLLRWTPAQQFMYSAAAREYDDGRIRSVQPPSRHTGSAASMVEWPTSLSWPSLAASGLPVHLMLSTEPPEAAHRRQHLFMDNFGAAVPHATVERIAQSTHEILDDAANAVAHRILACLSGDWPR